MEKTDREYTDEYYAWWDVNYNYVPLLKTVMENNRTLSFDAVDYIYSLTRFVHPLRMHRQISKYILSKRVIVPV